jgi:DNA polymerase (family 10)
MPVHNQDIAAGFDEMADLLALSGENPFRIRAYRRAAQVVRGLPRELHEQIAEGFDPDSLPGVGADLAQKIREFTASGECRALEQLRKSVPVGLRTLLALPEIGPQRARALFSTLGVHDLATLRTALENGHVRDVPRFGPKLEQRLLKALAVHELHGKRMLRSVASQYAVALKNYLAKLPGVSRVELAGSFRRGRETVGDLDVLVCASSKCNLSAALRQYDETASVLASGTTRGSITLRNGLQVDVRVVPPESFGAALYYFTGSKAHNIHVRRLAMARGLKINEYGVFRGAKRIAGDTEESLLATLDLPMIPPELREDHGEIEAASTGRLPQLVERSQLRGDLHVHTKQTDGSASLREMANAAQRAGLDYIAITDHSKYLGAVHGLDAEALAQQMEAIDAFNAKQKHVTVLKGIEVDILEDGTLALPDTILKQLDVVVVAVHGHFGLNRRKQTNRLLRALDHRYVSIMAHPMTRLLEQRPAIDSDWSKVFKRAAQRPCYLELNSQPTRLDLDDAMLREAATNGIAISIATDAHSISDFDNLDAGVLQARRGWLSAEQVINTKPLAELQKLLRQTFA